MMLDMRTLMITFVINSLLNTVVMIFYWRQNRKYFKGISDWTLALVLQTLGFLLLSSRGMLSDFVTIVVSNFLIVVGSFIIFLGFSKFVDHKPKYLHNYLLLLLYAVLQYYFAFANDSTSIRIILISVFTAAMFTQSGMLLLSKKKHNLEPFVKAMGYVCYTYVVIQIYRIFIEIVQPTTDYFAADTLATIAQVANQFLTIVIVFTFIISVNNVNLANRVKNELVIKDRERKLRDFIDNTSGWEFWLNKDGTIEYMSPSAEVITKYSVQEFIENPELLMNIVHPEDLNRFQSQSNETECCIEYRIIDKFKTIHWVEHSCREIFTEQGESLGRHVSVRDITENKIMEAKLKEYNRQLECDVDDKLNEIADSQRASVFALARITESRDYTTGKHIERVQHLCRELARALSKELKYKDQITLEYLEDIFYASILHDIGKVGIPDNILLKPGKLTLEEFDIIKKHVDIGANTLEEISAMYPKNSIIKLGIEIARYHHEKWNGKGYREGLSKEDIPLSGRIMAIVDAYDAIRANRPYKGPKTHAEAIDIIYQDSGEHFDPDIVRVFRKINHKFKEIFDSLQ